MSFLNKERHDHVLLMTMSSPDTRNALTSDEQFEEFERSCAEINDDEYDDDDLQTDSSAECVGLIMG